MVQLSYPYTAIGKTIAFNVPNFVGKVMSLLFNTLSRFVLAFLPKSKHLLISWLQSPLAVILEPKKIKSVTVSIVFPVIVYGCESWNIKKAEHRRIDALNCGVGEDS